MDTYSINLIEYYVNLFLTWIGQYVMFIYNRFMDFAPIIKVAAISLTFSIGLIIFTVLRIGIRSFQEKRWQRQYRQLEKRYGDGIKYVLSKEAGGNMTRKEVMDALELDNRQRSQKTELLKNYREKLSFARLVYRARISDEASLGRRKNLHVLLDIFDMENFLENVVNKGKMRRKAEALLMLRAFKLPVNQWIANRLRNSKRSRVRKLSMYASIMTSSNADLEYFETEFFDQNCSIYDEIQLGYVLQRRKAMKRRIPNLAILAHSQKNPSTQAVFVRLMRQFDQGEFCGDLEDLFTSSNSHELTQEICRTWGYLHYTDGEELMQEILLTQPDDTKVAIMHALARLNTGKSLNVLVDGYYNSGDQHVRYEALRCLNSYGPAGIAKFRELEKEASEEDKRIFDFFNNPVTRDETRLSQSDSIRTFEGENLYNVV